MKFFLSIPLLFLFTSMSKHNSSNPFTIIETTQQRFASGVRNGNNGCYYTIKVVLKTNAEIHFDSISIMDNLYLPTAIKYPMNQWNKKYKQNDTLTLMSTASNRQLEKIVRAQQTKTAISDFLFYHVKTASNKALLPPYKMLENLNYP